MAQEAFHHFTDTSGLLLDYSDDQFSSSLSAWSDQGFDLFPNAFHFGFVLNGSAELRSPSGNFTLKEGMYFSVEGEGTISQGRGVLMSRYNYRGLFSIGGPVEDTGRLRYIDGCSDTLLIPPPLLGDPCLNLLHIPRGTQQTTHTHPSLRLGAIFKGAGECVLPHSRVPLTPGLIFSIDSDALHSFHTYDSDLLVVAYHPESDFGPTHEVHPMVNRTIIPGR
jgi:hypothetical protein